LRKLPRERDKMLKKERQERKRGVNRLLEERDLSQLPEKEINNRERLSPKLQGRSMMRMFRKKDQRLRESKLQPENQTNVKIDIKILPKHQETNLNP
jgi:hypothetical protein